jgi:hypothetical protein
MKRSLYSALLLTVCAYSLSSQSLGTRAPEERPQIAYRLFSTWADNYQESTRHGKTVASGILYGAGALCTAGAVTAYYENDELADLFNRGPMDVETRDNLAMGLGIGAGALVLSGIIVSAAPVKDYRSIYADVFEERDPEVQEAMAVSVLRYQADQGKERRISSFIWSFAVPLLSSCITAGANVASGRSWDSGVLDGLKGSSWWIAGSVVSLFQKSKEERLYERYLATRDALYGSGR